MAGIYYSSEPASPFAYTRNHRYSVASGEHEAQSFPEIICPTPLRTTNHGQVPQTTSQSQRSSHWRTNSYGQTYYENPDSPRSPATRELHAHLPAEEFERYSAILTDPLPADTTPPPSPLKRAVFDILPESDTTCYKEHEHHHLIGQSPGWEYLHTFDSHHQPDESMGNELSSRLSNVLNFFHTDVLASPIASSSHHRKVNSDPFSPFRRSVRFDHPEEDRERVNYERRLSHPGHFTTFNASHDSAECSKTTYHETPSLSRRASHLYRSQEERPRTTANDRPRTQKIAIYATPDQLASSLSHHEDIHLSSHSTQHHYAEPPISTSRCNVMGQRGIERLLNIIGTALQFTQLLDPSFEELKRPLHAAQTCLIRQTSVLLGGATVLPEDWPHVLQADVVSLERLVQRIHDSLLDVQSRAETLKWRSRADIRDRFAGPAEQLTELVSKVQDSMDQSLSISLERANGSAAWRT